MIGAGPHGPLTGLQLYALDVNRDASCSNVHCSASSDPCCLVLGLMLNVCLD